MAPPLPQFVAISSSTLKNKHFGPSGPHGVLKSEEVDEVSVHKVKHEVVNSQTYPGMIHLKCVDTGKYWSWGLNPASVNNISAQHTKRVRNLSSNDCTVIKYSHHIRDGVSFFHLEFRWNSNWCCIKEDSGGFLKSGEQRGRRELTNFVIEDWNQVARASKHNKNTGGGTSSGNIINGVAIGKLYVDKMICVMPDTSQPSKNVLNDQVFHLLDGKDKAKK